MSPEATPEPAAPAPADTVQTPTELPNTLPGRLAWISANVIPAAKDGRNADQGWTYPKPSTIILIVKPLLAAMQVQIIPHIIRIDDLQPEGKGTLARVWFEFTVQASGIDDTLIIPWVAQARAYGGANVIAMAITIGTRTFLSKLFLIPDDDDDPDAGGHGEEATYTKQAQPQRQPQAQPQRQPQAQPQRQQVPVQKPAQPRQPQAQPAPAPALDEKQTIDRYIVRIGEIARAMNREFPGLLDTLKVDLTPATIDRMSAEELLARGRYLSDTLERHRSRAAEQAAKQAASTADEPAPAPAPRLKPHRNH